MLAEESKHIRASLHTLFFCFIYFKFSLPLSNFSLSSVFKASQSCRTEPSGCKGAPTAPPHPQPHYLLQRHTRFSDSPLYSPPASERKSFLPALMKKSCKITRADSALLSSLNVFESGLNLTRQDSKAEANGALSGRLGLLSTFLLSSTDIITSP